MTLQTLPICILLSRRSRGRPHAQTSISCKSCPNPSTCSKSFRHPSARPCLGICHTSRLGCHPTPFPLVCAEMGRCIRCDCRGVSVRTMATANLDDMASWTFGQLECRGCGYLHTGMYTEKVATICYHMCTDKM